MELQFRLLGIPVRVSAYFLLTAVLLGLNRATGSPVLLMAWIAVVFTGVLLHELGHAFTARAFGQEPAISFHAFGGLTSWTPRGEVGAGKRLVVSLAGPALGIAVGLAVWAVRPLLTEKGTMPHTVLVYAVWVNFGWSVLNLLPMLPLDGGRVMASVFDLLAPGRGFRAASVVSVVVAAGVGLLALLGGALFATALCALFVYVNVQALRAQGAGAGGASPPETGEGEGGAEGPHR